MRPLPIVVPMLAPMITLIAGRRPKTPALTRPTVMTVIAVLDWITPVMNVPASRPVTGVPATLASKARILLTANAWMPFDMNSRPSMKMPNPPITGTIMSLKMSACIASPLLGRCERQCHPPERGHAALPPVTPVTVLLCPECSLQPR